MSLGSKARRLKEVEDLIAAEQKKLLERTLEQKKKSIALIRASRDAPGKAMCELVKIAETERAKIRRTPAAAKSKDGSRRSTTKIKRVLNPKPGQSRDPCESPTTQRKLLQCMRKCCVVHSKKAT
jgi:cytochrome P450